MTCSKPNFCFCKGERTTTTKSKKGQSIKKPAWPPGHPLGSWVLNGLLIFWITVCSTRRHRILPGAAPVHLMDLLLSASCREVFNCIHDWDDHFYCVQSRVREREPLLGQVLNIRLFVISWPSSMALLLSSSLSSEWECWACNCMRHCAKCSTRKALGSCWPDVQNQTYSTLEQTSVTSSCRILNERKRKTQNKWTGLRRI